MKYNWKFPRYNQAKISESYRKYRRRMKKIRSASRRKNRSK